MPRDRGVAGHRGVAHEGPDAQGIPLVGDAVETLDVVERDDDARTGEAEVHGGHEAHAARQHLGLLAVLGQQRDDLLDPAGSVELDLGGDHATAPLRRSASRIALQTRAA